MRAQPLVYVKYVPESSRWYCTLLGAASGHGGEEYERIVDPKRHDENAPYSTKHLVLQLHTWKKNHHHGTPGDAEAKVGNGLLVWFVVDDFDAAAKRAKTMKATIVTDVTRTPRRSSARFG